KGQGVYHDAVHYQNHCVLDQVNWEGSLSNSAAGRNGQNLEILDNHTERCQ
ncbi:hypothetical protein H5410_012505, partial [Solanum commersonii]